MTASVELLATFYVVKSLGRRRRLQRGVRPQFSSVIGNDSKAHRWQPQ